MPAPLSRHFIPDLRNHSKIVRAIDNHYHLEMIAENQNQLVEYQKDSLKMQQEVALTNIRAMGEVANRQDQANSMLLALVGNVDQLNAGIDSLNFAADVTIDLLYEQTEVLQKGFEIIAERMLSQQKTLREIADIIRSPYETKALELLQEAENALRNGMQSTGRDQVEEFKDAERLLGLIIKNPIGSRNYVAWFQIGWINWKYKNNYLEAEEAFYQSARLSGSAGDLYNVYSQRHRAYMQYLQGRPADAYETVQKALNILPNDYDINYDAARYAAKTKREEQALQFLEKCIELHPTTINTMFAEDDFLATAQMQQGLSSLLLSKTDESRNKLKQAIDFSKKATEAIPKIETLSGLKINLTNDKLQGAELVSTLPQSTNYIHSIDYSSTLTDNTDSILISIADVLQKEIDKNDKINEESYKNELEKAKFDYKVKCDFIEKKWGKDSRYDFTDKQWGKNSNEYSGKGIVQQTNFKLNILYYFFSLTKYILIFSLIYYFLTGFFRFSESFLVNIILFTGILYFLWKVMKWLHVKFAISIRKNDDRKIKLQNENFENAYINELKKTNLEHEQEKKTIEERKQQREDQGSKADEALKWLEKTVPSVKYFIGQAVKHRDNKKYGKSMYYCNQAIAQDPNALDAHFNLSVCFDALENYNEAINAMKKVLEIEPNNWAIHFNLGLFYKKLNRKAEAQMYFENAIKLTRLDVKIKNREERIQNIEKELAEL